MQRLDRHPIDLKPGEILGFARVRNENLRLPWCLAYHRRLGIDRFFIVDNGSTDGSTEYLASRDDVHVFRTDESYADRHSGMDWINPLLREYGTGHWTLTVDADELLVYPAIERVDLRGLCRFLDAAGADALACTMVDMYGPSAIRDTRYERGRDFLEVCPYFDPDPLRGMRGGVRDRLFWRAQPRESRPPYLGKIPLVRWRSDLSFAVSTHLIDGVVPGLVEGALLHFKMFHDFHRKVAVGAAEGQYWEGSRQYRAYIAVMDDHPGLTPRDERSVRFEDAAQLVRLGFMKSTPELEAFAAAEEPADRG
jgi:glycosyltransferase involved in cell wall biosynthesis